MQPLLEGTQVTDSPVATPVIYTSKNVKRKRDAAERSQATSDILNKAANILKKIDEDEDGFGRFIAEYMRNIVDKRIREKAWLNMLQALYSTVYENE